MQSKGETHFREDSALEEELVVLLEGVEGFVETFREIFVFKSTILRLQSKGIPFWSLRRPQLSFNSVNCRQNDGRKAQVRAARAVWTPELQPRALAAAPRAHGHADRRASVRLKRTINSII